MLQRSVVDVISPAIQVFSPRILTASAEFRAFWKVAKSRAEIGRGQTIVGSADLEKRFTVLLEGVACFSTQHEDGDRQIHTFHYPGDFLGIQGFVFPLSGESGEVQALTSCSVGTVDRDILEREIKRQPLLGRALWKAAMTEASIVRQRWVVSRRPALHRVAHLLCEQLARLEIEGGLIPLSQIDVADAAGLSVVHANRVFQELRQRGMLSRERGIEIVDKERLQELAAFDGRYLDLSESLSQWDLRIDD